MNFLGRWSLRNGLKAQVLEKVEMGDGLVLWNGVIFRDEQATKAVWNGEGNGADPGLDLVTRKRDAEQ